jgi:transcriptional regulator with XRE-family HTH domain
LELAGRAVLSVPYLSAIERGERDPPMTTVAAIAKAAGVPVTKLVE